MSREQCIKRFSNLGMGYKIHESTVCTSDPSSGGVCHGDFGGPLITRDGKELIGLASWIMECGDGRPDVYTRVFSHLEFIKRAMSMSY